MLLLSLRALKVHNNVFSEFHLIRPAVSSALLFLEYLEHHSFAKWPFVREMLLWVINKPNRRICQRVQFPFTLRFAMYNWRKSRKDIIITYIRIAFRVFLAF